MEDPLPASYKVDKERRLVMSCGSGALTREDILGHQERLSKDPDFDPDFSQLADVTQVTKVELSTQDMQTISQRHLFSRHSRRAILVKNDLQFGLARMIEVYRESVDETGLRVFRDINEALEWVLTGDRVV